MDITGLPKDNYHYYRSVFYQDPHATPVLHLFPHWNWQEGAAHGAPCKGRCTRVADTHTKTIDVWAYGNGHAISLALNGVPVGPIQNLTRCRHVSWQVPYAPGELTASMYAEGGGVLATQTIRSTGAPRALRLELTWPVAPPPVGMAAEGAAAMSVAGEGEGDEDMDKDKDPRTLGGKAVLRAGNATRGGDVALVTLAVVDAAGDVVPTANVPGVRFRVRAGSAGRLIGLGNGDPSSHEPDRPEAWDAGTRSAWNGYARVVLQADAHGHGVEQQGRREAGVGVAREKGNVAGAAKVAVGTIGLTAEAEGLDGAKLDIPVVV